MATAAQTMFVSAPVRAPFMAREQTRARTQVRPAALPALTGLRFVAAGLVVVGHLCTTFRPTPALAALTTNGGYAVNLFFLLSGFILAYTNLGAAGALRGTLRSFYVARFARVYPLYLLAALVALPPFLWSGAARHAAVVLPATLLLVQGWLRTPGEYLNVPAWSLSCEALFYLLFPVLARALAPRGARALCVLAALLWLGSLALALWYPGLNPEHPLARVPEFALGIALGRLFLLHGTRTCPRSVLPLAVAGLALCYALGARVPGVPAEMGLLDPLFMALIWGLAVPSVSGRRSRSLLATPTAVALGEASYALYLLHWPLWSWYTALVRVPAAASSDPRLVVYGAVYVALTLAAALLAYRWVEAPGRRLLRARLG